MQFWGFSVLQRHGVSLPASDFFSIVFFLFGDRIVKVAKIHSSSKRKKAAKSIHFLSVSEVYVRHFSGCNFGAFSVLQRHGVSLPAGDFFPLCFPIWGPDVKVAKIHSSSKRKKEPKASFSMGFRSYVRHFRGAILGLLRPKRKKAAKKHHFLWVFRSFVRHFRGAILGASPSFRGHGVFPAGR